MKKLMSFAPDNKHVKCAYFFLYGFYFVLDFLLWTNATFMNAKNVTKNDSSYTNETSLFSETPVLSWPETPS